MTGRKWGGGIVAEKVICSLAPKPDIYIELDARHKIAILMEEYRTREWLGYLVGMKSEHGNYFVEELVVPPHKESYAASAEAVPFNEPKENCIGILHSHHTMGAFHSTTDKDYVDKNFPISIVVSRETEGTLKYNAVAASFTPCGKMIKHEDCEVKYLQPEPGFDAEKWLTKTKKDIDKGERAVVTYGGGYVNNRAKVGQQEHIPWYKRGEEVVLPKPGVNDVDEPPSRVLIQNSVVREIRKKIHEERGILLTRSEIENWLDTNTYPPSIFSSAEEAQVFLPDATV